MKKIITAAAIVMISLFSVSAVAGDVKLPLDSAASNIPPNNQKKVEVVERTNLEMPRSSTQSTTMTVEQLVSDRPTIQHANAKGGSKLCTTDSQTCVSAKKHPETIQVATFKLGIGAPKNERTISRKDFDNRKMAVPTGGVHYLDCQMKNGKNTGNCRVASNS